MKQPSKQQNLFSAVTPRKIPDAVYKQMVALISSGRLKPGERLPSERDMAADMGVSRQSIREAINKAKTVGLIEVKQGGGSVVVSSVKTHLKTPMSIILEEQAEKIFEFLEIRRLFEGWCAERAAVAAKPADLRAMTGLLKGMEELQPGEAAWEKADLSFHSAIAAASHNLIAIHIMEGLKASFNNYFKAKKFALGPERKDLLLDQHAGILAAIKQKNMVKARERMTEHLKYVEEVIRRDFLDEGRQGRRRQKGS
jgi:GntR family transcriptional regulator, transcriptional repressor for pyruvate dehydrogenase complex